MRSLHYTLKNKADVYVNKRQRVAPLKKEDGQIAIFTSHGLVCNCSCIALLLHLLDRKSLIDNNGGVQNA